MQTSNHSKHPDYVISYLLLRQLIGLLGISLPFILVVGNLFFGDCTDIQPSISHYYFSYMNIVFTGTLCVLGGFLISYRGKVLHENKVSNFAGAFAFGVAIFPTTENDFNGCSSCKFISVIPEINGIISGIHYACAALLFICFMIFCFKIFQQPDEVGVFDVMKKRRNYIYKCCGWGIAVSIASIGLITIYNEVFDENIFPYKTLIFETTALLFFGCSWLLKGSLNWPEEGNKIQKAIVKFVR